MSIKPTSNIVAALIRLDSLLHERGEIRELIACGGGVLSIVGILSRQTRDLDVIQPEIDRQLLDAAQTVALQIGLDSEWLNNGPSGFVKDLEKDWELRTEIIFQGKALTVRALGRRDLIATKLQGLCDRDEYDLEDLIAMKPTSFEIESLRLWLLERDASPYWPNRVASQLHKLLSRISNGA